MATGAADDLTDKAFDDDGFFRTGDLFQLEDDQAATGSSGERAT